MTKNTRYKKIIVLAEILNICDIMKFFEIYIDFLALAIIKITITSLFHVFDS